MKKQLDNIYLTREQYIELRLEMIRQLGKEPTQCIIDSFNKKFSQDNWHIQCKYYNEDEYKKYKGSGLIAINDEFFGNGTFKLALKLFKDAPVDRYSYVYTNI